MENKSDTVVLEIEGTELECNKTLLIKNSDYFSAMFTGNFKESHLDKVKIESVDLKSFNAILMLLWDETYQIEDSEIYLILQTACMLQFNAIKELCVSRILEILKPSLCLKIWKTAELLDISPLWLKAKCMALEEFSNICNGSQILEFDLNDICSYLGHIYLNVNSELTVFQTAMNWWYENQRLYVREDYKKVLLRLLNCINFKTLSNNDLKEMGTYPDIVDNSEITAILNYVSHLKESGIRLPCNNCKEEFVHALHLYNSKDRKRPEIPCLLVRGNQLDESSYTKKLKHNDVDQHNVVVYDKFLRKRTLSNVEQCPPHAKIICNSDVPLLFHDQASNKLVNLFRIGGSKIRDLAGFKILSSKEFIFLYGGEFLIGAGNWNRNLWAYNAFKEKWERKTVLPHGRRHFETVIIDKCIYIIGGIGRFRLVQGNLLWYDFLNDEWSTGTVALPCELRQFKCCSFCGQLCIVYMTERKAYLFNKALTSWRRLSINMEGIADKMRNFVVFSDINYLYIKGKRLHWFKLVGDNLIPAGQSPISDVHLYVEMDSVLCNDVIYTLYKHLDDHYNTSYTFESYNLKTKKLTRILVSESQEASNPTKYLQLFSFNSYYLVRENVLINDPIVK